MELNENLKAAADAITLKRINTAHPAIRAELILIYEDILKAGLKCRFTSVFRDYNEQSQLFDKYQKGGPMAARPGLSFHNYGLAVDFVLLLDNGRAVSWDLNADFNKDAAADWFQIINIFKKYGWEAGADWKKKDYPHVQKTFNYKIRELLKMAQAGRVDNNGYLVLNIQDAEPSAAETGKPATEAPPKPKEQRENKTADKIPKKYKYSIKCPICGDDVELNGPGSTANLWQRSITRLINTIYPISQRIFRPAADRHDLAYHIGPKPGETAHTSRLDADNNFLKDCENEIEKSGKNWIFKRWLRYQANKYYLALRVGGAAQFPRRYCLDETRKTKD